MRGHLNVKKRKCSLHAAKLRREHKHTIIAFITYCFCTATTVTRTRLDNTLCVHCPTCFKKLRQRETALIRGMSVYYKQLHQRAISPILTNNLT